MLLLFLVLHIVLLAVSENIGNDRQAAALRSSHNVDNDRAAAAIEPRQRRAFGALLGLGKIAGMATQMGCKLFPTKACPVLSKIPFFGRKRRAAESENAVPAEVGELLEKTTSELKKVSETEGFTELSELDQERKLLESVEKLDQGELLKEKVKETIVEAERAVDKSLDRIVMYTEGSVDAKMAMQQVFKTITDDAKTPKQKVEKVKELEEKWSAEVKEALKPNMDEKVIDEAAHFFSSVPQQIDLGAK
ncbi:hypothetical protein GPALN_014919 [Globodera pallida]|nr:hypothetical protein GPALN_014919 [Globodera pallida]